MAISYFTVDSAVGCLLKKQKINQISFGPASKS